MILKTWWTFRIFFIFLLLREGKGKFEAPGVGGVGFLLKIPGGGGGFQEGEGPRGREGGIGRIFGGGGGVWERVGPQQDRKTQQPSK